MVDVKRDVEELLNIKFPAFIDNYYVGDLCDLSAGYWCDGEVEACQKVGELIGALVDSPLVYVDW